MNDYGVFAAINELVRRDEFLSQQITSIVTEPRPGMQPPYMLVRIEGSEVDIPCAPRSALVSCELQLSSTYNGDQEIHTLMSRLDFRLNGAALQVEIPALNAQGVAVFKAIDQEINRMPAEGKRIGTLSYQIKINIRRN